MQENAIASALPPQPPLAGAAGYDASSGSNGAGMGPPTLPPVVIPQNNNSVPSPISPGAAMSPSSGGVIRRAAPEPNKRALYVGGLDPRVTEDVLKQIFETTGHVVSVKVIPDKTVSTMALGDG